MNAIIMKHILDVIDETSLHSINPLTSGFDFIDEELGGYHSGEVITVAGTINSGKTAFVVSQVDRLSVEQKVPTLVGLGLMDYDMFLASLVAYHYSIKTSNLWGLLNDPKYKTEVEQYKEMLKESPLFIADSVWDEEDEEDLEISVLEKEIRIVFLDELELFPEENESAKMKQLAIHSGATIVETQVIDKVEVTDRISCIRLSDIKGYADTVIAFNDYEYLGLYTDEKGRELHGLLGIEILKQKGFAHSGIYSVQKSQLFLKK